MYIPITTIEAPKRARTNTTTSKQVTTPTTTPTTTTDSKNDNAEEEEEDDDAPAIKIVQVSVQELWDDPLTENLQRLKRLLVHCEQRRMYEQECVQRRVRLIHPHAQLSKIVLVNVPEPSLPLKYHAVPTTTTTTPPSSNKTTSIKSTKEK